MKIYEGEAVWMDAGENTVQENTSFAAKNTMYTQEQIQAYLERVHFQGKLELTKETLDKLVYGHQISIPFENLDVYEYHKSGYDSWKNLEKTETGGSVSEDGHRPQGRILL